MTILKSLSSLFKTISPLCRNMISKSISKLPKSKYNPLMVWNFDIIRKELSKMYLLRELLEVESSSCLVEQANPWLPFRWSNVSKKTLLFFVRAKWVLSSGKMSYVSGRQLTPLKLLFSRQNGRKPTRKKLNSAQFLSPLMRWWEWKGQSKMNTYKFLKRSGGESASRTKFINYLLKPFKKF